MPVMRKFVTKVCETGFITDEPTCNRARAVHTLENIEAVSESKHENSSTSLPRI